MPLAIGPVEAIQLMQVTLQIGVGVRVTQSELKEAVFQRKFNGKAEDVPCCYLALVPEYVLGWQSSPALTINDQILGASPLPWKKAAHRSHTISETH